MAGELNKQIALALGERQACMLGSAFYEELNKVGSGSKMQNPADISVAPPGNTYEGHNPMTIPFKMDS